MLDSSRCSVDDRNANQEAVARMNWRDRISADPAVLVGKPVVRGTRISVELILELLAAGYTTEQVEVAWIFAGLGALLVLAAGGLSLVWFNRLP